MACAWFLRNSRSVVSQLCLFWSEACYVRWTALTSLRPLLYTLLHDLRHVLPVEHSAVATHDLKLVLSYNPLAVLVQPTQPAWPMRLQHYRREALHGLMKTQKQYSVSEGLCRVACWISHKKKLVEDRRTVWFYRWRSSDCFHQTFSVKVSVAVSYFSSWPSLS